ncbi:helix-turn-helix transcriptional regulator [Paenibacillus sp. IB182496]|uniref:Helix-turn-helix transcriptional regulator n=1 Tax=Paenibacillus sabuli TaxID=2772509 RepID=A0A927GSD6_9BACL|nr:AraC family transcriptional regulator [Paenibacillus sabuli]MBD2846453.1 helix-turn-helix transcriptional regulator [Paenibacillus sabuli]
MNRTMLKENRMHGDSRYPVSVYRMDIAPDEPLLDLHWHDELELLQVTSGGGHFRVGITDYELEEGQALFIGAGELHCGWTDGVRGCAFEALVFHPEFLYSRTYDAIQDRYVQPLAEPDSRLPVRLGAPHTTSRPTALIGELCAIGERQAPGYELQVKGLLYLLLAELWAAAGEPSAQRGVQPDQYKTDRLKTVLQYMHTHYGQPLRLRDLAASVSMSEAYFCRFFKEMTRRNPIDYLNQYRMQQAASMMRATDRKLTEIALDVGFGSLSYFITMFKRHFGCTPTQYRSR